MLHRSTNCHAAHKIQNKRFVVYRSQLKTQHLDSLDRVKYKLDGSFHSSTHCIVLKRSMKIYKQRMSSQNDIFKLIIRFKIDCGATKETTNKMKRLKKKLETTRNDYGRSFRSSRAAHGGDPGRQPQHNITAIPVSGSYLLYGERCI